MNIARNILFFLLLPVAAFSQIDSSDSGLFLKGCFPVWKQDSYPIDSVPLDKITHLKICFAYPEAYGALNTQDIHNVDDIVTKCHEKGVKVVLSIGGAAQSANFPLMAEFPKRRTKFIASTLKYVQKHEIDGVDIDWEHWPNAAQVDTVVNRHITALFKELHAALSPHDIWLSYDVYASDWYGKHYPTELINYMDEMVIMAFDGAGAWSDIGHHSPVTLAQSAHAYWLNRIGESNAHKMSIAIPFYGYEFQNEHTAGNASTAKGLGYNEILSEHTDAYLQDTVKTESSICIHNSINTLKEKIDFAQDKKLKGIVIWELSFDQGTGEKSLLKAISKEVSH